MKKIKKKEMLYYFIKISAIFQILKVLMENFQNLSRKIDYYLIANLLNFSKI